MPDNKQEKKKLEERLRQLREDLEDLELYTQDIISFVPVGFCLLSGAGKIVNSNEAFENLTGYDLMEVSGKYLGAIFKEEEKARDILGKAHREETLRNEELVLVSKEGKEIPVSLSISARRDQEGELIGYFIGITDITELKALQQNLEERVKEKTKEVERRVEELSDSRKALMNILEDVEATRTEAEEERDKTLAMIKNFPEGLMFFDRKGRLSSVNPRVRDFFDLERGEVLGKKPLEIRESFPNTAPLIGVIGEELRKVKREEIKVDRGRVLEISTIRVTRDKQKIGTLVVIRDVTREKLIQKLKTEFVSIAAHQLRTPLSAIKWTLRMILDEDVGRISKEQKDLLEKTYSSNERMIKLINDLLNVTRIEEGRFLYDVEKEDLVELVKKTVEPLKRIAERKGVNFEVSLPKGDVPEAIIDAEKMSLAIQNLVENAVHYTDSGEIEVALRFLEKKKQFLFSVKDSGIGIPKEQQPRIFSKFFRAPEAIKSETEGTGLGLFIAKNIVESHKGKIWFESEKEKGTNFYFTVPVRKKELEKLAAGF